MKYLLFVALAACGDIALPGQHLVGPDAGPAPQLEEDPILDADAGTGARCPLPCSTPEVSDPPGTLPTQWEGSVGETGETGEPVDVGETVEPPPPPDCYGIGESPADSEWTVRVGGVPRTFDVHLPPAYDHLHALPLVLGFHGYSGTKEVMASATGLNDKADEEGFIAVYPQGLFASWNAGLCCVNGSDDVGFVRAILDRMAEGVCYDPKRVYATGFSNGGMMTHRLACSMPDRIAAFAPVSGVNVLVSCAPSRGVPLLHIHGTADAVVPWNGNGWFRSVPATMAGWAARDECAVGPVETWRHGGAHCDTWSECRDGATLVLCTLDGGTHTWPEGGDFDATDAIWEFLKGWRLP